MNDSITTNRNDRVAIAAVHEMGHALSRLTLGMAFVDVSVDMEVGTGETGAMPATVSVRSRARTALAGPLTEPLTLDELLDHWADQLGVDENHDIAAVAFGHFADSLTWASAWVSTNRALLEGAATELLRGGGVMYFNEAHDLYAHRVEEPDELALDRARAQMAPRTDAILSIERGPLEVDGQDPHGQEAHAASRL